MKKSHKHIEIYLLFCLFFCAVGEHFFRVYRSVSSDICDSGGSRCGDCHRSSVYRVQAQDYEIFPQSEKEACKEKASVQRSGIVKNYENRSIRSIALL